MNEKLSVDDIKNAVLEVLSDELEDALEEKLENVLEDKLEDTISDVLSNHLPEALNECLASFEFVLKDGTVIRPKHYMRLLSPDKSKQLLCYGGLKVNEENHLIVQTRISCWEDIAVYSSREEAIEQLLLVKNAMDKGMLSYEL